MALALSTVKIPKFESNSGYGDRDYDYHGHETYGGYYVDDGDLSLQETDVSWGGSDAGQWGDISGEGQLYAEGKSAPDGGDGIEISFKEDNNIADDSALDEWDSGKIDRRFGDFGKFRNHKGI